MRPVVDAFNGAVLTTEDLANELRDRLIADVERYRDQGLMQPAQYARIAATKAIESKHLAGLAIGEARMLRQLIHHEGGTDS